MAALALGSVQGDHLRFTYGFGSSYPGFSTALISSGDIRVREFGWKSDGVTVEEITLWSRNSTGPIDQGPGFDDSLKAIPTTRSKTWPQQNARGIEKPAAGPLGRQISQGEDQGEQITAQLHCEFSLFSLTSLAALLYLHFAVEPSEDGGWAQFTNADRIPTGYLLYLKAKWAGGYSYSQLFSVTDSPNPALDRSLENTTPAFPETSTPTSSKTAAANIGGIQTPTSAAVTATGEPTNASDGALGGGLHRPTSESASNNGGGLALGAIIGIAVGCGIAGLLVILGLVWYLLRRRKQKKALHPGDSTYGTGSRGEELMAEKEASADVDVTPHSPYSDDGAPGGSGAGPNSAAAVHEDAAAAAVVAGAAGAMAAPNLSHLQDPPRSFTPYSDRPSVGGTAATAAGTPSLRAPSLAQTDEARVSVPSPIPGRATPRGLTTPYAHLVEEGMTEDEIRRLEDEERQLDAAIEQAGRR